MSSPVPDEDRAFERYRAQGDAAALAEVFDSTAPALLAFARSTVADHHLAEDLVQQTFVAAIESRADWDPDRSLLPWLMGILAHRARNLGRREQRRRHAPIDELVDGAPPVGSNAAIEPPRAASDREFDVAFRSGIDALPDAYGSVVDLHLRHGLTAAEIARTLNRPAGTVRTQIVRGSRLLRAALPQGFAVASVAVAVRGTALASIRGTVLQHASAAGAVARPAALGIGSFTLTALLMNKSLAALAAILAVGLSLAVVITTWPATGDAPTSPNGPPSKSATAGATAAGPSASDTLAPLPNARQALGVEGALPTPAAALAVRVVQEWDGKPARRVRVVVTDDAGTRTEFSTEPDGIGRCDWGAGVARVELPDFDQAETVQLAGGADRTVEFRVPPWLDLEVRVVDPHSAPVASAELFVFHGLGPDFARTRLGRTDTKGVARVRTASGSLPLRASAPGHLPSRPKLLLAKRPPRGPVQIVLGAPARPVRIEVSNLAGRPAAGAHVEVYLPGRPFLHPLIATTGIDGVVEVELPEEPSLVFAAAGMNTAPAYVLRDVPATTTNVSIRLKPSATVTGTARDKDGAPVAGAKVSGAGRDPRLPRLFELGWKREAETGPDGSFVLEGLVPGTTVLKLRASGSRVEAERDLVPGANAPWDPLVPPSSLWTVRLAAPTSPPQSGGPALSGWIVEIDSDHPGWDGAGAVTDAEGLARFEGLPRDAQVETVRVKARAPLRGVGVSGAFDGATTCTWDNVSTGADQELDVSEDRLPSARLRGAIHGRDGLPAAGIVVSLLRRVDGVPVVVELVSNKLGRFEYGPTAPGSLTLAIRDEQGTLLRPDMQLEPAQTRELGALYLGEPARVSVRLMFTLQDPTVAIRLGQGQESGPLDLGDDGIWQCPAALPPGDYIVEVRERGVVVREHALLVKSGQDVTVEVP